MNRNMTAALVAVAIACLPACQGEPPRDLNGTYAVTLDPDDGLSRTWTLRSDCHGAATCQAQVRFIDTDVSATVTGGRWSMEIPVPMDMSCRDGRILSKVTWSWDAASLKGTRFNNYDGCGGPSSTQPASSFTLTKV